MRQVPASDSGSHQSLEKKKNLCSLAVNRDVVCLDTAHAFLYISRSLPGKMATVDSNSDVNMNRPAECIAGHSVMFEGYVAQDQTLTLCRSHTDYHFIDEFDRQSSKNTVLTSAIKIASMGFSGRPSCPQNMIDLAKTMAHKLDPVQSKCCDEFIRVRMIPGRDSTNVWVCSNGSTSDDEAHHPEYRSCAKDCTLAEDEAQYDPDEACNSDASEPVMPPFSASDSDASIFSMDEMDAPSHGDHTTTLLELICKTGAFPVESNATLALVAMCAYLPKGNPDLASDYFRALTSYISRRHDLQTRRHYSKNAEAFPAKVNAKIAKDIVMLWFFFRTCLQTVMVPQIDPYSFIQTLHQTRPLFLVSDTEYDALLAKCRYASAAARCFQVYGNGDPERKKACREAVHTLQRKENGWRYSQARTDDLLRMFFSSKSRITGGSTVLELFSLDTDARHPGFQNQLDEWAHKHGESLIARLTADESYDARYVRDLPMDKQVIMLRAACGTGKSVQMQNYIGRQDEKTAIIIISHRKALSAETKNRLLKVKPFELYSKIEGKIDLNCHKNVICEYESLSRVLPYKGRMCVIIDEVNSVLSQTQSKAGDPQGAHAVFLNLMRLADRVLMMDAFLDQDRIDVLKCYIRAKPYVIENTHKPNADQEIWRTTNKTRALQELLSFIEKGENVIVPCSLKSVAEEIYHLVCSVLDPEYVQLYTSEKRWQNGSNVNEVWSKARVVIYTSTMDSGHSFEQDHFGWAVCFFSSRVPIPVEGCLQMKARSRRTKRFVICIDQLPTQENPALSTIKETIDHVLRNEKQMAETSCKNYYGEVGYWRAFRKEQKQPVCPFLMLYATVQMLNHRSRHKYAALMYEMLREDGVQMENIRELDGDGSAIKEAVKKAAKEAKEQAKVLSPGALAEIYDDTPKEVFESVDSRKLYSSKKVIDAYLNRRALLIEGADFTSAMQGAKEKQDRLITAVAATRSSGQFSGDSILQTEMQVGFHHDGPNQTSAVFVESNSIASQLCLLFTREPDPLNIKSLDGSKLRVYLRCTPREQGSASGYVTYEIEQKYSRRINQLYDRYLMISGNTGSRREKDKPMSLTEGLTILNKVLQNLYGITLERTKRRRVTEGKKLDYVYEGRDLFLQATHDTLEIQAQKPILRQGGTVVVKDEDLLSYKAIDGVKILGLGAAFDCWPGNQHRHGYKPLDFKCLEMIQDRKRQKLNNEKGLAKTRQLAYEKRQDTWIKRNGGWIKRNEI